MDIQYIPIIYDFFLNNYLCYCNIYEKEHFPGITENEDKGSFEMTLSTGNTFTWPNKPDRILYAKKNIVELIIDEQEK